MTTEVSERVRSPLPTAWKVVMSVAVVATFLCCAWALWPSVAVFDDEDVLISVGLVVALPVLMWLVLAAIAGVKYANWWRWGLLIPVSIIVTLMLLEFHLPGRIGWLMTRDDMDRAAAVCETLETGLSDPRYKSVTIGQYDFHHVDSEPDGGCEFNLSRYYPVVRSGFVYIPSGRTPTSTIDTRYVHLGGYWYYFG
ncbi:hypothetical protein ACFC06_13485 [Nocardia sp. NPDC056064]|uniref:hypothetical protein n=1 Tax=Nocardia sp. NPDC056064 TaxID=3345701 RepID=UPI0035D60D0E